MNYKIAFLVFSFVTAIVPVAFFLPRLGLGGGIRALLSLFMVLVSSQFLVNILFGGSMFYPAWPLPVVFVWGALNSAVMMFFFLHIPCYFFFGRLSSGRRLAVAGLVAVAALALASVGAYNSVKIPCVKEMVLEFEDLPPQFDGYRIAQLSDIHCSQITPRSRFEKIVERTNAAKPDLICVTGDCVDGWVDRLGGRLKPLVRFAAPDGVLAIPGNHEYYWDWGEWRPFLEGLGFSILENAWTNIVRGSSSIVIAGVTDVDAVQSYRRGADGKKEHNPNSGFRQPDHMSAFDGAPRNGFRVLLMHRPHMVRLAERKYNVRLQLSGHTHGGALPGLSPVVSYWNEGHVRGLYEEGKLKLYVSPGTGQWAGLPIRLFNPTEITLFTLRRNR